MVANTEMSLLWRAEDKYYDLNYLGHKPSQGIVPGSNDRRNLEVQRRMSTSRISYNAVSVSRTFWQGYTQRLANFTSVIARQTRVCA